jgi:hypothetical protein
MTSMVLGTQTQESLTPSVNAPLVIVTSSHETTTHFTFLITRHVRSITNSCIDLAMPHVLVLSRVFKIFHELKQSFSFSHNQSWDTRALANEKL